MKKSIKLCFFLICLMGFQSVQAQLLKDLARKIEEAGAKNASKKSKTKTNPDGTTTTTTEEQIDGGEGKEVGKILEDLGGLMGKMMDFDVKPKTNYTFSSSATTKMTMVDKKGKSETQYMKMLFHKDQPAVGMIGLDANKMEQADKGMMIMDMEQTAFFTFSTDKKGNKSYFGMKIKTENLDELEKEYPNTDAKSKKAGTMTKTGKTKTIMGISCEGYLIEEDDKKITLWVTSQSNIPGIKPYYESMKKYSQAAPQGGAGSKSALEKSMEELAQQGKAALGSDMLFENGSVMMNELDNIKLSDVQSFSTAGYTSAFEK